MPVPDTDEQYLARRWPGDTRPLRSGAVWMAGCGWSRAEAELADGTWAARREDERREATEQWDAIVARVLAADSVRQSELERELRIERRLMFGGLVIGLLMLGFGLAEALAAVRLMPI